MLLILAAVTISFVLGDDGIINKAKEVANSMNNAVANDQASLNDLFNELNDVMNGIGGSEIQIQKRQVQSLSYLN